jgi:hypothetical protein
MRPQLSNTFRRGRSILLRPLTSAVKIRSKEPHLFNLLSAAAPPPHFLLESRGAHFRIQETYFFRTYFFRRFTVAESKRALAVSVRSRPERSVSDYFNGKKKVTPSTLAV